MTTLINYFVRHHLVSNLIVALIVAGGLFAWQDIRKEELPDFTFDYVSISTFYPGAAPHEVEQAITLPIEQELADLEGIRRMESSSRRGSSSIRLELERGQRDIELIVSEINNRIQAVQLPREVENPPLVRNRKTQQKAIIDVCLFFKDKPLLSDVERQELQRYMRTLENQLLRRSEISILERDAYLNEELHILPRLDDLLKYQLSLKELRDGIIAHHTEMPLGIMESAEREQVHLAGRLEEPEAFYDVPLRSTFIGHSVRVSDVADVKKTFADTTALVRINGHEGVIFNVVKSSQTDILDAVEVVRTELDDFIGTLEHPTLTAELLDDESYDVRNRLSIISDNALIGFVLIITILSIFLNPQTAVWVTLGIPFSLLFTIIIAYLLDFTVNNITLAGVIISMGMLVDDAIVVSENIARLRQQGMATLEAAVVGTRQVIAPILASILTTIAAFLPLLTFEGHLALLTTTIPPIVALVLTGSLIESIIILPGHLTIEIPFLNRLSTLMKRLVHRPQKEDSAATHFFQKIEEWYAARLERLLRWRLPILGAFVVFVAGGGYLFFYQMNFSLFPREKVATMFVIGQAPAHYSRYETLKLTQPIEKFFLPGVGTDYTGIRTTVGYRRYRPVDQESVVSVRIELNEEKLSGERTAEIVTQTREFLKTVPGFKRLQLSTQMFGSDSGSALEILVQEENDAKRDELAELLTERLKTLPEIGYVEIDRPAGEYEYRLIPERQLMDRLGVSPLEVETTLRSSLAGLHLYNFYDENEKINVRLRFPPELRSDINQVLAIPASNREGFQVPLRRLVRVERRSSLNEVQRINQRRVLRVNADIKPGQEITPLELAERLEREIFPELRRKYNSAHLVFDGEVQNTRESSSFFIKALTAVILLIYFILAAMFNSLYRPVIVMLAILPAWSAAVYIFLLHGINVYGFFAIVGALGLSGIVVNSAILLLDRIERDYRPENSRSDLFQQVATLSATRLRAVFLTTVTTVAGLFPTAYGVAGYDSMLAEMMLTIAWGLIFAMSVTLLLVPILATLEMEYVRRLSREEKAAK